MDNTTPMNPTITMIKAAPFLYDGCWDATRRYFVVAANQSNTVAVLDAEEDKLVSIVDTPVAPHPGRGANWIDPQYGSVWSTSHLGDAAITSIGTYPDGHAEADGKAVRVTMLPGSDSTLIKTHHNSKLVWTDMTLKSDPVLARTICAIARKQPDATHRCWEVSSCGCAVHMDYNK